ncbi:MAG: hypothetical protein FJ253_12500 [Phycisphaerae bacterium]|nr:hypothetical protein [Phycisphaerae bacterium]
MRRDQEDSGSPTAERFRRYCDGFMGALLTDPRVDELRPEIASALGVAWPSSPGADPLPVAMERVPKELRARADQFARETLGLPWSWAGRTLLVWIARDIVAVDRFSVASVPAPPIAWRFATRDGESCADARARLRTEYEQMDRALRAHEREPGERLPKHGDHLETWGRWFYEARVQKPPRSVSAIAGELDNHRRHVEPLTDCGCRQTVTDGIAAVARLFNEWGGLE